MGRPQIEVVDDNTLENSIKGFIHCRECLEELPKDLSPRDFVHQESGFTGDGVQIWCVRHEKSIALIRFSV